MNASLEAELKMERHKQIMNILATQKKELDLLWEVKLRIMTKKMKVLSEKKVARIKKEHKQELEAIKKASLTELRQNDF